MTQFFSISLVFTCTYHFTNLSHIFLHVPGLIRRTNGPNLGTLY